MAIYNSTVLLTWLERKNMHPMLNVLPWRRLASHALGVDKELIIKDRTTKTNSCSSHTNTSSIPPNAGNRPNLYTNKSQIDDKIFEIFKPKSMSKTNYNR